MNNDLSSYFEDPEFKDLLAKYEGMVENHTPTYFDAEELTDIAEYYASKGEEIDFSKYITTVLNHQGQGYTTENVQIDASEYNPDKPGTYNIFYTIKSGETNITRNRLVAIVREDKN